MGFFPHMENTKNLFPKEEIFSHSGPNSLLLDAVL